MDCTRRRVHVAPLPTQQHCCPLLPLCLPAFSRCSATSFTLYILTLNIEHFMLQTVVSCAAVSLALLCAVSALSSAWSCATTLQYCQYCRPDHTSLAHFTLCSTHCEHYVDVFETLFSLVLPSTAGPPDLNSTGVYCAFSPVLHCATPVFSSITLCNSTVFSSITLCTVSGLMTPSELINAPLTAQKLERSANFAATLKPVLYIDQIHFKIWFHIILILPISREGRW